MNNFKEEAERRYPKLKFKEVEGPVTAKRLQRKSASDRLTFISGADFGYQQGIEEGMRFAEWCHLNSHKVFQSSKGIMWLNVVTMSELTTAELFEIFKKEQP